MPRRPFPQSNATILSDHAYRMRHAPTRSEAILWGALSAGRLGVAFRRQVVIGRTIADFAAASVRLVVEVDGAYHAARDLADARRDRALERAGWRVVHVPAELVVSDVTAAVALVRAALAG